MKKNDLYLLLSVIGLAAVWWLVQRFCLSSGGSTLTVRQDGVCIGSYSLEEEERLTFTDQQGGENVLVICGGEAYIEEADCPDGLCMKQKPVARQGESIICLPHRLVIEVTEGEENTVDAVAQ